MKRYTKLYIRLLHLGFVSLLTYRVNFINNMLSSALFCSLTIFTMILLTARTSSAFGWTRSELLMLTAIYNLVFSIFYTIFSFDEMSRLINRGELDAWLLKPIDTQFGVTTWKVGYASLIRFIISFAYLWYLVSSLHMTISLFTILNFIILTFFSILLIYALSFLFMTLTVWFTTLDNLIELLYYIYGVTRYPREMYHGIGYVLFFLLFPLTLVIIIPTRELLSKTTFWDTLMLPICSVALFFLSRKFWRFSLRFYTSASG